MEGAAVIAVAIRSRIVTLAIIGVGIIPIRIVVAARGEADRRSPPAPATTPAPIRASPASSRTPRGPAPSDRAATPTHRAAAPSDGTAAPPAERGATESGSGKTTVKSPTAEPAAPATVESSTAEPTATNPCRCGVGQQQ